MIDTQPRADALVLFGATGDLAKRKLFPALYHLEQDGALDIPVIGVARSNWTDESFRVHAREAIIAAEPHADAAALDPLCRRLARPARLVQRRVLHGDPADDVSRGRAPIGLGGPERARTNRRREAVRP
jgi:hypothetical protein